MIAVREFSTAEEIRLHAQKVARIAAERDGKSRVQVVDMSRFVKPVQKPINDPEIKNEPLPIRKFWHRFSTAPVQMVVSSAPTVKFIIKCVSRYCDVLEEDIRAQRRQKQVCVARHMAAWGCRRLTTLSLPAIGRQMQNRDHTTILHAIRKVDASCAADPQFNEFASGFLTFVNHQWYRSGE